MQSLVIHEVTEDDFPVQRQLFPGRGLHTLQHEPNHVCPNCHGNANEFQFRKADPEECHTVYNTQAQSTRLTCGEKRYYEKQIFSCLRKLRLHRGHIDASWRASSRYMDVITITNFHQHTCAPYRSNVLVSQLRLPPLAWELAIWNSTRVMRYLHHTRAMNTTVVFPHKLARREPPDNSKCSFSLPTCKP